MKQPVVVLVVLLGACGGDRARPDPFGPHNEVILTANLLVPANNQTVPAGSRVSVRVGGAERGERLIGLGYFARHISTLDSAVVRFETVPDSAHTFFFTVPRSLMTNTQIEIYGLAFGPFDEVRRTNAHTVIVIGCGPGNPCE